METLTGLLITHITTTTGMKTIIFLHKVLELEHWYLATSQRWEHIDLNTGQELNHFQIRIDRRQALRSFRVTEQCWCKTIMTFQGTRLQEVHKRWEIVMTLFHNSQLTFTCLEADMIPTQWRSQTSANTMICYRQITNPDQAKVHRCMVHLREDQE